MPGKWIERFVDQHICEAPTGPTGVTTGDQWQCDICQTILTVTVNQDQRDGPWLSYTLENGTPWDRTKSITMKRSASKPTTPIPPTPQG